MIVTKAQVLKEFKDIYGRILREERADKHTKNEMFWEYADRLMKDGYISHKQWVRWENPF